MTQRSGAESARLPHPQPANRGALRSRASCRRRIACVRPRLRRMGSDSRAPIARPVTRTAPHRSPRKRWPPTRAIIVTY